MIGLISGAALAFFLACVEVQAVPVPQVLQPFRTLEVGLFSGIFPDGNATATGTDGAAGTGYVPTGTGIGSQATGPAGVFVSLPYATVTVTITQAAAQQSCAAPTLADSGSTQGAKLGPGADPPMSVMNPTTPVDIPNPVTTPAGIFGPPTGVPDPVTTPAGVFGPGTGGSEPASTPAGEFGPTTDASEPASTPAGIFGTGTGADSPPTTVAGVPPPVTTADGVFWTGTGAGSSGAVGKGTGIGGELPTPSADPGLPVASTTLSPTQGTAPSAVEPSIPIGTDPGTPSMGFSLSPMPTGEVPFGNSTSPTVVRPSEGSPPESITTSRPPSQTIVAAVIEPISTMTLERRGEKQGRSGSDKPADVSNLQVKPRARSR